ncbi:hypothetical protein PSHT_04494 [Puccinia striiformis]|uniref:Secreted protein n=1 Tax=Puccinia striiformis TaxID=27350 RepID=A0A2S4WCZ6_9BASI|nr:hypothetical protein PSHT_04494 [Puccinia striiformis]
MRYLLVLCSIMFLWTAEVWSLLPDECASGCTKKPCAAPKKAPKNAKCTCCFDEYGYNTCFRASDRYESATSIE